VADRIPQLRGFAFPFRIDPRSGGVAVTDEPHKLSENLEHLLLSRVGERLMVRDYGGGVSQLFQETVNEGLLEVARLQVSRAILRYEPRVLPQDVTVVPGDGSLHLRVLYVQAESPGVQATTIPIE
jgi:hypothetical protein